MVDNEFPYRIRRDEYEVLIYEKRHLVNSDDTNLDVELIFDSGERYVAALFTLKNIQSFFEENKATEKGGGGFYFQCPYMIIVETMNEEAILKVIEALLAAGRLDSAFKKVGNVVTDLVAERKRTFYRVIEESIGECVDEVMNNIDENGKNGLSLLALEDLEVLKSLKLTLKQRQVLRKALLDMGRSLTFSLFCMIDGVTCSDQGDLPDLSLIDRETGLDFSEQFLHDEYWDMVSDLDN